MSEEGWKPGQPITAGILYRRIPSKPNFYDHRQKRPTSLAFRLASDEQSVSMTLKSKTSVDEMLAGHEGFGLCEIDVEMLIGEGLASSRALRLRREPVSLCVDGSPAPSPAPGSRQVVLHYLVGAELQLAAWRWRPEAPRLDRAGPAAARTLPRWGSLRMVER